MTLRTTLIGFWRFLSLTAFATFANAADSPPASLSQLQRLLDAINSGDRAVLEAAAKAELSPNYHDSPGVDDALVIHKQLGGFDLLELKEVRPQQYAGWVRARDSDALMQLLLDLEPAPPNKITFLRFEWGNPPQKYFPARWMETEVAGGIRRELEKRAAADKFSGAVLVTRDDQILVREAYGMADRERKVPNTVDTRFRTASLGKMFTAVAVLRLVQDRKLGLDDPIGKVLPELSDKPAAKATIRHLLSHTSGTGDIFGPRYDAHSQELRTHDDFVRLYGGDALSFKSGARYQYSNLGYILLGAAIERVSGKSYYDYLQEVVFSPAGMKNSDLPVSIADMTGRARGYGRPPGTREWLPMMHKLSYRGDGAGGAFSTIDDMGRFLSALRTKRLLDEKHSRMMQDAKVEIWKGKQHGYGLFIETYAWTGRSLGHDGGEPGTNSEAWFMPDSGYAIVVLSNFDPNAAAQVAEFVRGRLPLKSR